MRADVNAVCWEGFSFFFQTEIKNVGSVRAIRKAIQFEISRQSNLLESSRLGGVKKKMKSRSDKTCFSTSGPAERKQSTADHLTAETRMWNDATQVRASDNGSRLVQARARCWRQDSSVAVLRFCGVEDWAQVCCEAAHLPTCCRALLYFRLCSVCGAACGCLRLVQLRRDSDRNGYGIRR